MADFDPYLKWLGIRDASRPINHYRLLGLDLYESDRDVISMAADRQMAHIRTYQSGPNGDLSQQILNELARARRCLLVSEKKQKYDQELKASLAPPPLAQPPDAPELAQAIPVPPNIEPTVVNPVEVQPIVSEEAVGESASNIGVKTDPNARAKTKKRERKQLVMGLVGWISGGLAAVGIGAVLLSSGIIGGGDNPVDVDHANVVANNSKKLKPLENGKTEIADKGTTGNTEEGVFDPANPVGDLNDLSRISGIGETTQVILKKENVTSIPQLASMSASDVADVLRKGNFKDAEDKLDDFTGWITQAKKLIGDTSPIKASRVNSESPTNMASKLAPPTVWTTANLAGYPQPSVDARALMGLVVANVSTKRLKKLGSSYDSKVATSPTGSARERKAIGLGERALVVGLAYSHVEPSKKIKSIQPLFLKSNRVFWGDGMGDPDENSTFVLAKEGYALGEVQVSLHDPIHCFRIRFMKITRTGLDSRDSYYSNWHGLRAGPVTTIQNALGAPVVAIYGECTGDSQIHSLGLIGGHLSFPPTDLSFEDPKVASTLNNFVGISLPVVSTQPVNSSFFGAGLQEDVIVFYNRLKNPVEVFWVDESGNEKRFFPLPPRATRSQFTRKGAAWHIKEDSRGIATYIAAAGRNSAIIDGRAPDPDGSEGLNNPAIAEAEIVKHKKPSSSERSAAIKEVKKTYGDLVGRGDTKKAFENRDDAESLIRDAIDQADNPALQYAMLETAKDLALVKGDSDTALRAVRELGRRFEGFELWPEMVETIEDAGRVLVRSGDKLLALDLEKNTREVIDEAMGELETRSASKLAGYAAKAAARKGDSRAEAFYKIKDAQISELFKIQRQHESAIGKLATDANNAQANMAKGKYMLVVEQDLKLCLESWAKSDNEKMLDIVEKESSDATDPVDLAGRWEDLGKSPLTLFGRRCYERAIEVLQEGDRTQPRTNRQKNYRLEIRRLENLLKM